RYTEVAVFTQKDVKEILALRCAIEVLSAKTCIENGRIPVEELRKQVDVIAARSEDAKPDTMAIMESDLDFHEIIIRASGNSRVLDVWNRLKSQMKVLLFTALINKSNVMKLRGADVHRPIIDAFIERDQDKVAVLIEEHISRSSMVSIEG
ncbi:MAG TPA: FCD domain-containing protein, partial [Armatimonadota bacterium]|nr:FCD domain-containing protein [Armatimonadota bacterium]